MGRGGANPAPEPDRREGEVKRVPRRRGGECFAFAGNTPGEVRYIVTVLSVIGSICSILGLIVSVYALYITIKKQ